jgi:hypothetical protein
MYGCKMWFKIHQDMFLSYEKNMLKFETFKTIYNHDV